MGMYRGLKQSTAVRKQVNQLGNGQPQSGNCQPIWKQVNHNQKTSQPQSENKSSTVRKHSINQETVNQSEKQTTTINQSGTKSIIAWKQSTTEVDCFSGWLTVSVNQPEKQSTTVSHSQETVNQSGNKSTTVKKQSAKQETVNQSEKQQQQKQSTPVRKQVSYSLIIDLEQGRVLFPDHHQVVGRGLNLTGQVKALANAYHAPPGLHCEIPPQT